MTSMTQPAFVTPALLEWARTSMRMDIDQAAIKAGVKSTRLADWENGTATLVAAGP